MKKFIFKVMKPVVAFGVDAILAILLLLWKVALVLGTALSRVLTQITFALVVAAVYAGAALWCVFAAVCAGTLLVAILASLSPVAWLILAAPVSLWLAVKLRKLTAPHVIEMPGYADSDHR